MQDCSLIRGLGVFMCRESGYDIHAIDTYHSEIEPAKLFSKLNDRVLWAVFDSNNRLSAGTNLTSRNIKTDSRELIVESHRHATIRNHIRYVYGCRRDSDSL